MEKWLKKITPKYYGIVAFLVTIITYALAFSYMGLLENGKYIIARSDLFQQYIPFIEMFCDVLKGEKDYWFSWNLNMGSNTSLLYAYYTLSPYNLLFLLLGKNHVLTATALVVILKAGTAAFTFQIFATKVLKQKTYASVLFAIMYALSGFQVCYYFNIMWMDAMYLFPIIILLIVRLIETKKWIGLVVAYAYLFGINFYAGYMAGMCSFFFFITYFIYKKKENSFKAYLGIVGKYLLSVVLSMGITCVIWFPALLVVLENLGHDMSEYQYTYCNPLTIYNNLFLGQMQTLQGVAPFIYCGIPSMLLLGFYILNRRIRRKEKVFVLALLAEMMLCMCVPQIDFFLHAFDAPNMLRFRYAYVFSFLISAIACRESSFIKGISIKKCLWFVLVNILIYGCAYFYYRNTWTQDYNANTFWGLIINIFFMSVWVGVLWMIQKSKADRVTVCLLVTVIISVELVVNAALCIGRMEHKPMLQESYEAWDGVAQKSVDKIVEHDKGMYRIDTYRSINTNTGIWYDFLSLSNFSSGISWKLMDTFRDLGLYTNCSTTIAHAGETPVTKSLLGVKYTIDFEDDFEAIPDSAHERMTYVPYTINEKCLSLGYMVSEEILQYEPSESPFENQNTCLSLMSGETMQCFEDVTKLTLNIENGEFENKENGFLMKADAGLSEDEKAVFHFLLPGNEKPAYIYFAQEQLKLGRDSFKIPIETNEEKNNENIMCEMYLDPPRIICLGKNAEDDYAADIYVGNDTKADVSYKKVYAVYYNEEEFERAYRILADHQLKIQEWNKNSLKGTVEASKEEELLFLSIPYDKNWVAYVDGEQTEILPVLNQTFMGIYLAEGEHEVCLSYESDVPGFAGRISVCGIVMTAAFFISKYLSGVLKKCKKF